MIFEYLSNNNNKTLQPKLENVPHYLTSSITVKREISPFMDYPWHYHPEHEIIFVEKSYGVRLMGNHIGNFSDGDLMFISKNLPHVWKNDNDFYTENKNLYVDVYVIQFCEDALSDGFFNLSEFDHVKKLFILGQQGVLIKGKDHKKISELIKQVYNSTGIHRLAFFILTLDAIAKTNDYVLISSVGYVDSVNNTDTQRISKVINFLMENFNRDIDFEEISNLVNLNISSFCRFFKSRTKKTCTQFLNEIRIAHACKLLVKEDKRISEICYETGYNNISYFNRQFKLITGLTASKYVKEYLANGTQVTPG